MTSITGFWPCLWSGFHGSPETEALPDKLSDTHARQEVLNRPGERTGQARSVFGQDYVITSTAQQRDNGFQQGIKAFVEVWQRNNF